MSNYYSFHTEIQMCSAMGLFASFFFRKLKYISFQEDLGYCYLFFVHMLYTVNVKLVSFQMLSYRNPNVDILVVDLI